jgi:hypothetical protein
MKTQLIAILTLSSSAMAYPAATWLDGASASQAPPDAVPCAKAATPSAEANLPAPEEIAALEPTTIFLPEMVVAARAPRKAKPIRKTTAATPATPPAKVRTCTKHQSQVLSGGKVVVCDVKRTDNGRSEDPFVPAHRFERLASRDLPSPTGLVRGGEVE